MSFGRIKAVWTGANGQSFTLTNRDTDPLLPRAVVGEDGPQGFGMPPVNHQLVSYAGHSGARYAGTTYGVRDALVLPTWLLVPPGQSPWTLWDSFLATLDPEHAGTLAFLRDDGQKRTISARYASGCEGRPDASHLTDQVLGFDSLTMLAEQPWFRGDTLSPTFSNTGGINFYGGGPNTKGPPFYISSGQTLAQQSVVNPGTVPCWYRWTITGPMTGFTAALAGGLIQLPYTLPAGRTITIDTDPMQHLIQLDDGTNLWPVTTNSQIVFKPLPPNSTSPLNLTVLGTTAASLITLTYTPLYRTGW